MTATHDPYRPVRRRAVDPMADQLRRHLRASGRSISHLARDAGVDRRSVARFLRGDQQAVSLDWADALIDALGMRATIAPAARRNANAQGRGQAPGAPASPSPVHPLESTP